MVPSISRKNPFHSSSSRGREEYTSLAQTRSLYPSHTSYCPQLSSFTPESVSTVASHFESPFAALGNNPAGYPSSIFQHLPAQAAFLPISSATPSDTSTPPGSLSAPSSRYTGMSPSPSRDPLSDYQLELYSVASVRRNSQPVPGSRDHLGSYAQPQYTVQTLRQDIAFTDNLPLNIYPTTRPMRTQERTWNCPLCFHPFSRRQDRDRHLSSHLPYWIACSYSDCAWRGYRLDAFRKHWFNSEHKSESGHVPDEYMSNLYQKLYDPGPLVEQILRDPISIRDAKIRAVTLIKDQAEALNRRDLLTDPWGHKDKSTRQYPRFSDSGTNAPPITSPAPTLSSGPPIQLWAPAAPVVPSLGEPYIETGNLNGQIFPQHCLTRSPVFVSQAPTIGLTNGVSTLLRDTIPPFWNGSPYDN